MQNNILIQLKQQYKTKKTQITNSIGKIIYI